MYCADSGAYSSVPGGKPTLYGTVYMALTRYYLTGSKHLSPETKRFIADHQDPETGFFIGPELNDISQEAANTHDREHLLLHLACATIPACIHFDIPIRHPARFARRFLDIEYLSHWLSQRDFTDAWLEGNNLLFVGQLLVYLRDHENLEAAGPALHYWFNWLDERIDPRTGLWGTDGKCTLHNAMAGGYHQLLVYYHENHPLHYCKQLIDSTMTLQNHRGGFSARNISTACEDVDAADILVNSFKHCHHRPYRVRAALRRLSRLIVSNQNPDGGFSYQADANQSHMGIPDTKAGPNVSTAFATWFRIHTLALCAELNRNDPSLDKEPLYFTNNLSMGWHREGAIHFSGSSIIIRSVEIFLYTKSVATHSLQYIRQIWWKLSKHITR